MMFLTCIMALSCAAFAEDKAASWGNLNKIREGEKIQVRGINKAKVAGTLVNFSDTAISVETPAGQRTFQRQDVRSVRRARAQHSLLHALLLGAAGAGIGAGIGAAVHHGCSSAQGLCLDIGGRSFPAAIGGVAGFLGGATIAALLPSHEIVYVRNAQ
jgi:hypothetical protein